MMRATSFVLASVLLSCGPEDTGGAILRFHAYASGPAGAQGPLEFDTSSAFHVRLTQARMHIGALYMRLGQANPGSANASCVGDTTYGLQVPGPIDVNLLNERPQEFSVLGQATTDRDQSGEIWLSGGDINQVDDPTPIVSVAGVATRDDASFPFQATITIGSNRLVPPSNPAMPGANPICKQRIVAPIPLDVTPAVGGNLLLRIDPRPWFADVDFSSLALGADGQTFELPDVSSGAGADATAGRVFYMGITGASASVYQFSWISP